MKKKLLIVFVLLLICCICILSGVLGYFVYRSTNTSADNLPVSSPIVDTTLTPTATTTPTSDWKVVDKQTTDSTSEYDIEITYPQITGYPDKTAMNDFNDFVLDSIQAGIEEVKSADYDPAFDKNSIILTYKVTFKGADVISIMLSGSEYTGGVHPGSVFIPINYDLKNNTELNLSDLFDSAAYLNTISAKSKTALIASLGVDETDTITVGTKPLQSNFQLFNFTKSKLIVTFGDYQVGPYAIGPQKVELNLADLGTLDSNFAELID